MPYENRYLRILLGKSYIDDDRGGYHGPSDSDGRGHQES